MDFSMKYYKTGNLALDALLGGGIPEKTTMILQAHPGSGAKVLAQSILYTNLEAGGWGIYFTSEAPPEDVIEDMKFFRWMFQK